MSQPLSDSVLPSVRARPRSRTSDLPLELFVALRYLLAKRKQAFISLISLISVIGVGVGVMALLIALALMTGLQGELRDRIVGSTAHVYVYKVGGLDNPDEVVQRLRALPHVVGAAPVIVNLGIATGASNDVALSVKGIIPELEADVTDLEHSMQAGRLDALTDSRDSPGIVLGRDLADKLGVYMGDTIRVLTTEGTLTPMGPQLRQRSFKVVGVFSLGLYEFDAGYGYVHLDVAKRLFGQEQPAYVEVRLDDMFRAPGVAAGIPAALGPEYQAQDWADMNRSLFGALWIEKMAISITIGLIVTVAALNIVASLILLVMEKSRDIAILKTMGCSAASIRRIFVLQGLIIGLVGTIGGAALGTALIYVLDRYKLISIPIDVYQISHVPFRLQPLDFVVVVVSAVLICFVATIYPSRQASKLDPAQALRYQ
ncbi:MAG TPA: ABC transporter permease [Vicinamibacterales bacterium]|nr:ABC transporter permease [Vicinamibacterales bacterium]